MRRILKNNWAKAIVLFKRNKNPILILISFAIVIDIISIKGNDDLIIFSILIIYLVSTRVLKLKSKFTFLLCLMLLLTMFLLYVLTGASDYTENAAVWLYFFLTIGVFQQLLE